ncbi:MAG: AAA family ATPase [Alphaproteobacteria bacterium]|jgi:flagellar biosynthesis protein FlhG|nr:AAA family ATPase [Alphaproteobacteria bacterium]
MDSQRLSNAIIIASGKGGVGKTWLSINLAQALSHQSKRVLLFDGDLGLANVDIQLGLNPKRDITSVLKRKCTFEEAILNYKPDKNHQSSIDIITGRTIDGVFTNVSKNGILTLRDSLTTVSPNYDHMILDLSAGLDQIIQEFSLFAKQCLVVVTDEPTSLTDAYAFINVTSHRNPDLPLHIVVNMAESETHGQQIYGELMDSCHHFLKKTPPLVGIIHRDHCVPESILKQKPTLTRHPTSQVAQDIERLAEKLIKLKE